MAACTPRPRFPASGGGVRPGIEAQERLPGAVDVLEAHGLRPGVSARGGSARCRRDGGGKAQKRQRRPRSTTPARGPPQEAKCRRAVGTRLAASASAASGRGEPCGRGGAQRGPPCTAARASGGQAAAAAAAGPSRALAAGVFKISTAVATFKRLVNTLGTPKDTPELREKIHKARQNIGQLVKETSAKLKDASEVDHQVPVPANKKLSDAKLAKDFQAILKEFQKAQRIAADRETIYQPFVPAREMTSSTGQDHMQQAQQQQVIEIDNELVFNEAIIEERDQGIREIQQQIGEVHEIFKDLAVLIHEQGGMIDDIEANIESGHALTMQANTQLSKAAKSQRSANSLTCWLMCIFGGALLIILLVVLS